MDKTFLLPHKSIYREPDDKPTIEIEIGDEYWKGNLVLFWNGYGCCLLSQSNGWLIIPEVLEAIVNKPVGAFSKHIKRLKRISEDDLIADLLAGGFEDVTIYPEEG